jgi:hypothetical protein
MVLGDDSIASVKIEPEQQARAVPAKLELVPC